MTTTVNTPRPGQLEQLCDSTPSQPTKSSASPQGNLSVAQGTFHAPLFVNVISGSVQDNSTSSPPQQPFLSKANPITHIPAPFRAHGPSTGPIPNLFPESVFSMGSGRAPVLPKFVVKILSNKFIKTDELFPENLDDPVLGSFTIEDSTIIPVVVTHKILPLDIFDWVECFNTCT